MVFGIALILLGVLILYYPHILIVFIASLCMVIGLGIVAMSWQFRRLRRHSQSRVVNWIMRF